MSYTIGELAEEFDVTPRAIRFYEERGLISPERRGASRVYGARDRARLRLILRGKRLGFSLEEIREMIELYEVDEGEVRQLEHCLAVGRERIAVLERQREDIEAVLEELRGFEEQFVRLLREKGVEA
ncbi:MAG: MerR family DNA-binding transcriptional regulator [Actinomycetota bacterium]